MKVLLKRNPSDDKQTLGKLPMFDEHGGVAYGSNYKTIKSHHILLYRHQVIY